MAKIYGIASTKGGLSVRRSNGPDLSGPDIRSIGVC